jgi:hypothetical protein
VSFNEQSILEVIGSICALLSQLGLMLTQAMTGVMSAIEAKRRGHISVQIVQMQGAIKVSIAATQPFLRHIPKVIFGSDLRTI